MIKEDNLHDADKRSINHEVSIMNCDWYWEWDGLEMKAYTADFETTTDPDDCRVWAAGICDIDDNDKFWYGNSMEWFINWCEVHANCKMYFHNLAFDGAFIMDWLERNGWMWVKDSSSATDHTYTTLISDMNMVYSITLFFTPAFRVRIYDSLKIIPLSVAQMAKSYKLPILKSEIDYAAYREPGHELTEQEVFYLNHDVKICAMVLNQFLAEGMSKMTAGSNALFGYKKMMGGNRGFRKAYPELSEEEDTFIRRAYRGGFTYADPRFRNTLQGEGLVYDVNSLYPSVMRYEELPFGSPKWFDGAPVYDEFRPLWVASISFAFKIKPNHIPCIQIKGNYRFSQREYLTDSDGVVTITLTNVDWDLIQKQYEVSNVVWNGGYNFPSTADMFIQYVDYWTDQKIKAGQEGNAGKRQIAKLMLNSLYGKFATRTEVLSRRPVMENGIIRYVDLPPEVRKPVYLPVGVFITSYARKKTISAAQDHYDRFMYADTDSIHLLGSEIPKDLDIDDFRLGAWKLESTFKSGKYLGAKCYVEEPWDENEKLNVHVAGLPAACHKGVTMDNFMVGAEYDGKLYQYRVPGGIVLKPGTMEIRERL